MAILHVLSLAAAFVLGAAPSPAYAETDATTYPPLTGKIYHYPDQIPYQVDTDPTGRGPQFGYNQCNSTTEGQNSDCQLAMVNSIDDFCIWAPPNFNSTISDEEAETVAWCSKPGHGARTIPAGTLTGVQVLKAPAYVLVTGVLNQFNINIQSDDGGGEMDPHGDDQRGNPLGGLVYTNAFPSNGGNNNTFQQVIEWHNFMGSEAFCFKICDPAVPNSVVYCNNRFDRTGCDFVAPAAYQDGVFEVCESDNMDPVGVYTTNGAVETYSQPPEGVDITSLPSVKTPASSNCVPYTSSLLYAAAASVTVSGGTTSATSTGSVSASGSSTGSGHSTTVTKSGSSSTSSSTHASSSSGAARAGVQVPGSGLGVGMGPLVAVAASVLAGLGAIFAGL